MPRRHIICQPFESRASKRFEIAEKRGAMIFMAAARAMRLQLETGSRRQGELQAWLARLTLYHEESVLSPYRADHDACFSIAEAGVAIIRKMPLFTIKQHVTTTSSRRRVPRRAERDISGSPHIAISARCRSMKEEKMRACSLSSLAFYTP